MNLVLVSMLSVALGATLKYAYDKISYFSQKALERESQAYVDYLKSVAFAVKAHRSKDEKEQYEAHYLSVDSKTRICIFGHQEVAKALFEFEKLGAVLGDEEQVGKFILLVQAMRKRSCKFKGLSDEVIKQNLFRG